MTAAERSQRSRFMRAIFKKVINRKKRQFEANWIASGNPEFVGRQFAGAHFDWDNKIPKYDRWALINATVLQVLGELENDFAEFRGASGHTNQPRSTAVKHHVSRR